MSKKKLYDVVKQLLIDWEELRNSDKKLLWAVWNTKGLVSHDGKISRLDFYQAPSSESVTRARRKVQENHPELQATSAQVKSKRGQKQQTKGTFVYREEL